MYNILHMQYLLHTGQPINSEMSIYATHILYATKTNASEEH